MRVLVTGGAGFIGANLIRAVQSDARVAGLRVVDDLSTGAGRNLVGIDVDVVETSVLDVSRLGQAMRRCDAVVHLAALPSVPRSVADPMASHDVNVNGTLNVLEAARKSGVNHVLLASSSSVYGANPKVSREEHDWTRPLSPYGASKLAAEAYALAYQHTYGLKVTAFRLFNVYGPYQRYDHPYAAVIPRLIHAAISQTPTTIFGDGSQSRDFTYVDTVTSVIIDALWSSIGNPEPVNLALGGNVDINTIVELIESTVGYKIARTYGPPRLGDIWHSRADISTMRELFPNAPRTSIREGIARTVEWYQSQLGDLEAASAAKNR